MAAHKEAVEKLRDTVTPEEYLEYKQPQDAHYAYYNGDTVTFEGDKYLHCTGGVMCVWSPVFFSAC